ncbi:MAG: GAF domain-containing protein [Bacteroidales bacterium]|nr:GAF domain-containing protein [Bacteroidales bacterium]
MKYKMRINIRMMLPLIGILLIIMILLAITVGVRMSSMAKNDAMRLVQSEAENYGNLIKAGLELDMGYARAYAQMCEVYASGDTLELDERVLQTTRLLTEASPSYFLIFNSLELSLIDPSHTEAYGRRTLQSYLKEGEHHHRYIYKRTQEGSSGDYAYVKEHNCEMLYDPYLFDFEGKEKLITSVSASIQNDGRFAGIAGIDVSLDHYQAIIDKVQPYKGTHAALMGNNGTIIAHTITDYVEKHIGEVYPADDAQYHLSERIKSGRAITYHSDGDDEERICVIAPITVGKSPVSWAIYLSVPMSSVLEEANRAMLQLLWVFLVGIVLQMLGIYRISRYITTPIKRTTQLLNTLAEGDIDPALKIKLHTGDEMEEMARSTSQMIDGLNRMEQFARAIEQGDLEAEYTPLSDRDALGKSLIAMRESLLKLRQQDIVRQQEEQQRAWVTHGLATFGEVLRQHNDSIEELSYLVIKNLVQYTSSVQGGIYMVDSTDPANIHLEMSACFAYDRRKYLKRTIMPNEGLVGRCYIERKPIFMRDIPQGYMTITSGLGQTSPTNLLLVPMQAGDNVVGVLELASLNAYQDYEREFIERIADSIAGTLTNVRINLRTSDLLEKTQQQAEMMHAQEEEMRQNMEELHATQEEMERKREEQERMQAQLLEDKSVLNSLLGSMDELVYHKNLQLQYVRASASALQRLFGMEQLMAIKGRTSYDLLGDEQAQLLSQIEDEVLRTQTPVLHRELELLIDGQPCRCTVTVQPLFERTGEMCGLLTIITPRPA